MNKIYLSGILLVSLVLTLVSCQSIETPPVSPAPEEKAAEVKALPAPVAEEKAEEVKAAPAPVAEEKAEEAKATPTPVVEERAKEVKAPPIPAAEEKAAAEKAEAEKKEVVADYGNVKPYFIENHGQIDPVVKYYVKGPRGTVYLSGSEIVFDFLQEKAPEEGEEEEEEGPPEPGPGMDRDRDREKVYDRLVFRLKFVEANPEPVVRGEKQLGGKINYFIGSEENWHSNIPTFEEVIYEEIFDGVDLKYYFRSASPESVFIVKPGADPEKIVLLYEGVDELELKPTGELVAITRFGGFVEQAPRIYQEIDGQEVEVEGKYKLIDDFSYAYDISAYDPAYPLMIE